MRKQPKERFFDRLVSRRRTLVIVAISAAVAFLIATFAGRQLEIAHLHRTLRELDAAYARTLERHDVLEARLAEQDDSEALEAVAREKLGLVMPGEEKVIFVEE